MTTTPFIARSRALTLALVTAGVLSAGVSSADADPSEPAAADPAPLSYVSEADRERMARQAPLIEAADLIEKAAEQDSGKDRGSGYRRTSGDLRNRRSQVRILTGALLVSVRPCARRTR
jgi:hypothetical protein